jgi:hypothetical protein
MEVEKEKPRGDRLEFLHFPIALHPFLPATDDSGRVFSRPPNPRGISFLRRFRRRLPCPFRAGLRSISEQRARLLMASAPLPRPLQASRSGKRLSRSRRRKRLTILYEDIYKRLW